MLQATIGDGLSFDAVSLLQDYGTPSEIDIGGREIIEALVISVMIVVRHESFDAPFEIDPAPSNASALEVRMDRKIGGKSCLASVTRLRKSSPSCGKSKF
jgi:hypothetical protein